MPNDDGRLQPDGVAVVIPCYRVIRHIEAVIAAIGDGVDYIICVDDKCPDGSGKFIHDRVRDKRVQVIFHDKNQGVGGAMITGYRAALLTDASVIVKLDGDGQMDPAFIDTFVTPIISGEADYTKGNRFFHLEDIWSMPKLRIAGNAALSFFSKLSTGYWNIFDPTNGYTAIHINVLANLPLDKISRNYFFESDMLFRLNTIGAVVLDIPMTAHYGMEVSGLRVRLVVLPFLKKHVGNFFKRIFYNYFLRDFNIASVELVFGCIFLFGGVSYGFNAWLLSYFSGKVATAGTVMLAALPTLAGIQFILGFLNFDFSSTPAQPIYKRILRASKRKVHERTAVNE